MLSSSPYEPPSRSGAPLTSKRLASSLELAVGFGIRPYGQQIPPHRGSLSRKTRQGTSRASRGRDEYGLTPPGLSPPSSAESGPAGRGRGRAEGRGATPSSGSHPSSSSASSTSSCAHPDCCEVKPLFPPSPTEENFVAASSSRRRTSTLQTYLLHLLLAPPSPPVTLLASTSTRLDAYLSSSTDSDDSYFSPRTPTDGEEVGQGGQISLGSPEVELVGGGGADVTVRATAFARALEEALGNWVGEERSGEGQSAQRGTRRQRSGGVPRGRTGQQAPVTADKSARGGTARPNTSSTPSTPPRRTSVEFGTCPLSSPTPSDTTDDEEAPVLPPRKKSAASTLSSLLSSLLSLPLLTHTSHLPQLTPPTLKSTPTPYLPPPTTTSPRPDPDACECFTSSLPLLRMPPLPPAKAEVLRPSFPTLREAALRRWVIQREMRKKGKIAVEVPWWESARVWGRCFGREKEGDAWGVRLGSGLRWEVVG